MARYTDILKTIGRTGPITLDRLTGEMTPGTPPAEEVRQPAGR